MSGISGSLEYVDATSAYGWSYEEGKPEAVGIELFWCGELVGHGVADIWRPDLEAVSNQGRMGFSVDFDTIKDFDYRDIGRFRADAVSPTGVRQTLPIWKAFVDQVAPSRTATADGARTVAHDDRRAGGAIAFLFLCFRAPLIFRRSLQVLANDDDVFIAHVDPKGRSEQFEAARDVCPGLDLVADPVDIRWGTFSMMEAELRLLRQAYARPEVDFFVLLSDDTFPLAPGETIRRRIANGEFGTDGRRLRPDETYFHSRYEGFHYAGRHAFNDPNIHFSNEDAADLVSLLYWSRIGKKPVELYHGSQWWVLTRAEVDQVLAAERDAHMRASFFFSRIPDEHYIHTVCGNDRPHCGSSPVFTEWPKADEFTGPRTFRVPEDLSNALLADRLFLRKVAPDSLDVVDAIARARKL